MFRKLATLRLDVPVFDSVEELRWRGPTPGFGKFCDRLKAPKLVERAGKCAAKS